MRISTTNTFGSVRVRTPHCEPRQRIGLLGGSFNPAHEAHLLISQIALKRLQLDRVWWIVTPGNPLKSKSNLAPLDTRLSDARTLTSDPRIIITDFEKDLASPFTAATLAFLKRRHHDVDFVWLMGADCLSAFHRWRNWRAIFATMPVAVIDRPDCHLSAIASPAAAAYGAHRIAETHALTLPTRRVPAWTFLTGPQSAQSSTALRAQAQKSVAKKTQTRKP
jgi:nicotinate-nucleotide adenylyltransferase